MAPYNAAIIETAWEIIFVLPIYIESPSIWTLVVSVCVKPTVSARTVCRVSAAWRVGRIRSRPLYSLRRISDSPLNPDPVTLPVIDPEATLAV